MSKRGLIKSIKRKDIFGERKKKMLKQIMKSIAMDTISNFRIIAEKAMLIIIAMKKGRTSFLFPYTNDALNTGMKLCFP